MTEEKPLEVKVIIALEKGKKYPGDKPDRFKAGAILYCNSSYSSESYEDEKLLFSSGADKIRTRGHTFKKVGDKAHYDSEYGCPVRELIYRLEKIR
ncbi:MAG: hypothetical protein ISS82_03260 [Nanoarchaeota archaeon]|nr:hypothetical protein [Nanoarchaeota archaeon]